MMRNYYIGYYHTNLNLLLSLLIIQFLFGFSINTYSQDYPNQVQLPNVNYQNYQAPTVSMPGYLESFTEDLSGSTITRIGDSNVFGTTSNRIRHNYSKDQTWNSDETLIKLAGYPAAILDAESYEFLFWATIPGYARWSNTEPNIMYGANNNQFLQFDVTTNSRVALHTFTEYSSIDFGYGEGNQDNNDRYVGLIGVSGATKTAFVYDILNDQVTGSFVIPNGDLDWFSMSQSGEYAVLCWRTDGNEANEGLKVFDIYMQNERHIFDTTPHGDLGYDTYGNEVFVGYGDQAQWDSQYSMFMVRLDGGGFTNLFPYVNGRGIWGGHVSCRNIDRPGWAYVSEQCCSTNPVAPREIFAIKLDNSGIIERYGKHHSAPSGYNHESQVVPNRNGTKLLFASNWDDPNIMNDTSSPSFILEFPQTSTQGITVNAGNDIEICEGESTTLSATGNGATNYSWSTGETTQSITVSPNSSTTYTVTLSNDSGDQVSDSVIVTVNPLPNANAGGDVSIYLGDNTTLTASGGNSYEWSTGETTQSITVSPNISTTYSVTVTQNSCSSDDSVIVTVDNSTVANAGEDVTICQGNSAILFAFGGTSYVWSTGETTQSIIVTPDNTTTYSVTVSDGQTSDTDSVIVNVNPLPNANAGDDASIYLGDSTTLTASGGDSYEWSTGETTQSITVSPNSTTIYSVTVTSNTCSSTDSVTVTISNIPVTANAGEDVTICQGENITLTASGGDSYEWNTGETTQSIIVSPNNTTTYSVTVSDGQTSDTDSVIVNVNPLPNANAGEDITIESGEIVMLSASGGNSYLWSTGETSQNIYVNPNENATYSVTAFINNCSSTDDVMVSVVESISAYAGEDVLDTCIGESVTLTASGGNSYLWNTGETTQSIIAYPELEEEIYTVTVSNGISFETDDVSIFTIDCSETEIVFNNINVYPNPTRNIANIKITGFNDASSFQLYDMHGRLLKNQSINQIVNQPTMIALDLSSYPNGIYILTIIENDTIHTKRIIHN